MRSRKLLKLLLGFSDMDRRCPRTTATLYLVPPRFPASTIHMSLSARALVLDDDPLSRDAIRARLKERFPGIRVESRAEPDPSGEFDVYLIDNEFDGEPKAASLARRIRDAHPDTFILAFSGTLDSDVLKALINEGCDGVCDKSEPDDMPRAFDILDQYLRQLNGPKRSSGGILGTIRSISELLREWNQRLDDQERRLEGEG